jgi:hypothetical protein
MENKEINPTESLAIINAMIDTAKNKLADDGFYFIFWGWLVTICALIQSFSIKAGIANGQWVWAILMPAGSIVSIYYGSKQSKTKKVKSYVDTYLAYLWGAFLIGMFITLILMPWNGYKHSYFFLMILYGISSFITGGLLDFKPLVFGSLFSFAFAALSVFLPDLDMFLCMAGALFCSHIVPGHILNSKFKSQNV